MMMIIIIIIIIIKIGGDLWTYFLFVLLLVLFRWDALLFPPPHGKNLAYFLPL